MSTWEAIRCVKYGLLGEHLSHSISPLLHSLLGNEHYRLIELSADDLPRFLREGAWQGLNVTIPYKKTVIPYCHALTPRAEKIGAVNVLTKDAQGRILGDNTDYQGMWDMIVSQEVSLKGKKVLILGSGGASATAQAVCRDMEAGEVIVVSRTGENNYQNLSRYRESEILINCTPVGMYPFANETPLMPEALPQLQVVFDCIYNPLRTKLVLAAKARGIKAVGGLEMLTSQAYEAHCLFGLQPQCSKTQLYHTVLADRENIVLIGMPGCGKSTLGRALAKALHKPFYDIDVMVEQKEKMPIPQIFAQKGEAYFRKCEAQAVQKASQSMGAVIATGGGSILQADNRDHLASNGKIIYLNRNRTLLSTKDRPLSKDAEAVEQLYKARHPIYQSLADYTLENNGSKEQSLHKLLHLVHDGSIPQS